MTEESSWGAPLLAGAVLLAIVALIAFLLGGSFVHGGPVGELEVRFPVPADDPGGAEFRDLEGGVLFLGPAHRFELSTVQEAVDQLGDPALLFALVEDQKLRFRTLTRAHVGQKMGRDRRRLGDDRSGDRGGVAWTRPHPRARRLDRRTRTGGVDRRLQVEGHTADAVPQIPSPGSLTLRGSSNTCPEFEFVISVLPFGNRCALPRVAV